VNIIIVCMLTTYLSQTFPIREVFAYYTQPHINVAGL